MFVEIEIEKFPLGRIFVSHEEGKLLHPDDLRAALRRHAMCDWGECSQDDWEKNNRAVSEGGMLCSLYTDRAGREFMVITEEDRLATTIDFPEDL